MVSSAADEEVEAAPWTPTRAFEPPRSVDAADAADASDETLADRGPGPAPAAASVVPRRIGRHAVVRRLGAGGMGVVYEAHDEQLDRRVAIKVLRGRGGETQRLRLVREAQALAQLSHPNVVQVFEVGTLDERTYVVMELVDGTSLDRWLRAEPRSVRRIVEVLVQAGEGLAAAHAAGLVHRDFKPGNVLVGTDGRVRVLDFGLARASAGLFSEDATSLSPEALLSVWDQNLTRAGAVVGTPAYISPEQLGTAPVTAASDQFAFCVVLYEALYQQHPFGAPGNLHALLHAIVSGRVRPPPRACKVPSRLRAAVLRGLAGEPSDRWPAMTELLQALRAALRPSRWTRGLAAAAVVAATATGAAWALADDSLAEEAQGCTDAEAKLLEVWGPTQRTNVERAFHGTGLAYAAQTWERVAPRLDAYAEAWRSTHAQACEARGAEELDRRMACLERLRDALGTQVRILEQADATVLEEAVGAVSDLRPPPSCLDADADDWAAPEDPERAAWYAAFASTIDRVEALARSGKLEDARVLAEQILADVQTPELAALEARLRLALGMVHDARGAYAEAEAELERAYFLARAIDRTSIVQRAAERLVIVVGSKREDPERAVEWARHVEAELEHSTDDLTKAQLLHALAVLRRERGEYAAALALHERSLALYRSVLPPDHPQIVSALAATGIVLRKLGRNEEARQHHEQAIAIAEAAKGPEHPDIANMLGNLAAAQLRSGQRELAAATMRRSLAIREAVVGPDSVVIAQGLVNLTAILTELQRPDEAEAAALRAIEIFEAVGSQPRATCAALTNLAAARQGAGRHAQAASTWRRTLVVCGDAYPVDHPDVANVLSGYGATLGELGELDEADAMLRRAVAILERSHEAVIERLVHAYCRLAKVSLARGRAVDAAAQAQQGLALAPATTIPLYFTVSMRWVIAQAYWAEGHRELAIAHARQVARTAEGLDESHAPLRDEIRAWRAEHDPSLAPAEGPRAQ